MSFFPFRYMHFCNDRRPAVAERMQAELGATFKYTLVMSKLGEEWRRRAVPGEPRNSSKFR